MLLKESVVSRGHIGVNGTRSNPFDQPEKAATLSNGDVNDAGSPVESFAWGLPIARVAYVRFPHPTHPRRVTLMALESDTAGRILEIEARQDEALRQLEELERRVEQVLAEYLPLMGKTSLAMPAVVPVRYLSDAA